MEAKRVVHALLAVVVALTCAAVAAAEEVAPAAPAPTAAPTAAPATPPSTAAAAAGGTVIKGYIERAKLDDEGNTAEIGVWDEAAQEFFIIAPQGPGAELKSHVGERMEATGSVREEDGQKILAVATFTLVKEERPVEPEGDLGESGETEGPAEDSTVTTEESSEGSEDGSEEGSEGGSEGDGPTEPGPGDEGGTEEGSEGQGN